ncbi:hypothetical protein KIM372_16760 [Bombiscardovia nodaiensis]|uniref:DUF1266 domain-containing protein n=1 Tax=Bombiscardovia nodaiensis TaxID=2932181 RepID=A0ABN6SDN8_9BIFI|nr:hypothetical protein KIM372_16760 [Bombiscardovia nodaiensis]
MAGKLMDKLNHAMMFNNWLHFKDPSPALDPQEQWIVAFGSTIWSFLGDYVNAFESEDDQATCQKMLEKWWGVTDAESYREKTQALASHGQRGEFQPYVDLIRDFRNFVDNLSGMSKMKIGFLPTSVVSSYFKKSDTSFKQAMKDLGLDSSDLTKMLMLCYGYGEGDDFAEFIEDFANVKTTLAWDAVRVVNVSSLAYSAGYVSKEEAMQVCLQLVAPVQQAYDSWRNVAAAYVMGSWLWDERTDARLDNVSRTTAMLLNNSTTLINQVPFK